MRFRVVQDESLPHRESGLPAINRDVRSIHAGLGASFKHMFFVFNTDLWRNDPTWLAQMLQMGWFNHQFRGCLEVLVLGIWNVHERFLSSPEKSVPQKNKSERIPKDLDHGIHHHFSPPFGDFFYLQPPVPSKSKKRLNSAGWSQNSVKIGGSSFQHLVALHTKTNMKA